jgi:hypothetical protein
LVDFSCWNIQKVLYVRRSPFEYWYWAMPHALPLESLDTLGQVHLRFQILKDRNDTKAEL